MCGQETVVRILKNTVLSGDISHAYLLSGPRGTGKTSSAKIFAKAVNCDSPEQGEPCLKCKHCLSFAAGNFPDYFEIDAASNRKIDDFREIRDQVQYPPLSGKGKYKVYVIDEAHMLTKEAANAFLKTLEEPPPYVIFILATTEPERLLPTILSRCIRLDFHLLNYEQVKERIQSICQDEKIEIEEDVIPKLILHGEGGLRNILTLLQRAVNFCGERISLEDFLKMMGLASLERIDILLNACFEGNKSEMVSMYRELCRNGSMPVDIYLQLLERIQNYISFLLKLAGDYPAVPSWVTSSDLGFWERHYKGFLKVMDQMQYSFHPSFHGEVGLLDDYTGNVTTSVSKCNCAALEKRLLILEKQIESGTVKRSAPSGKSMAEEVKFTDAGKQPKNAVEKNWLWIKKKIKSQNVILHAFLEEAQMHFSEGVIQLVYDREHSYHFRRLKEQTHYQLLLSAVEERFGKGFQLEIILKGEESFQSSSDVIPGVSQVAPVAEKNKEEHYVPDELKQSLLEDEGLKNIVQHLDAEIENVK
jgi:DNA polymerase-3 subunit gamma/tau